MKLKSELVESTYCVEMSTKQFKRILKWDRAEENQSLLTKLTSQTPARKIEYDAHFGPNVFFSITTADDTSEVHGRIVAIIAEIAGN
jgi:hypothetical protein